MNYRDAQHDIDRVYWRFRFDRISMDTLLETYGHTRDALSLLKREVDERLVDWPIDCAAFQLGVELDQLIMSTVEALSFRDAERTRRSLHQAYDRAEHITELTRTRKTLNLARSEVYAIHGSDTTIALILNSADQVLLREGNFTKAAYLTKLASGLTVIAPAAPTEKGPAESAPLTEVSPVNQRLRDDLERLSSWLSERRSSSSTQENPENGKQNH